MQNMSDYCTNYVKRYLLYGLGLLLEVCKKLLEFRVISNYEILLGLYSIRPDHLVLDIFNFLHISNCYAVLYVLDTHYSPNNNSKSLILRYSRIINNAAHIKLTYLYEIYRNISLNTKINKLYSLHILYGMVKNYSFNSFTYLYLSKG